MPSSSALALVIAAPCGGGLGASDEGHAEAPDQAEAAAIECATPSGSELAWLEGGEGTCPAGLVEEAGTWVVRVAEPGGEELARGPAPSPCSERACTLGGQRMASRVFVFVEVPAPAGEVPEMRLFGANGPAGELAFVPLWVDEGAAIDAMVGEPAFELRPYLCGEDVVLRVHGASREEEASDAIRASSGTLVWRDDAWAVEAEGESGECRALRE